MYFSVNTLYNTEMKSLKTKKKVLSLLIMMIVAITMAFGSGAAVFAETGADDGGALLWSYYVGGNYNSPHKQTPPAYYNGNVYFVTQHEGNSSLQMIPENVTVGEDKSVSDRQLITLAEMDGKLIHQATIAPTIDSAAGKAYVPLTGCIAIVPIDGGAPVYVDTEGGYTDAGQQTISPITYDDEYIYVGTWKNENTGTYYRIDKDTYNKTVMQTEAGFYWAGACPVTIGGESYVLFGSDAAKLYLYSNKDDNVVNEFAVEGKVRSTITPDGNGNYYFSTYEGFSSGKLYKISITDDKQIVTTGNYPVPLTKGSTCTPVMMDGNVYVGTAGKTIDVFSTDGVKNETLSCKELKGNVQGLTSLNGAVYASYNNKPGGIYNVTKKQDFYVPEESMQEYNAYLPVTNGKDKLFFKNDSGYLFAVSTKISGSDGSGGDPSVPDEGDKAASADVYVTIADRGELTLAQEKVKVKDIDSDGALTVNDALYAAHENYYEGGATAGYASANSSYGLSLTKLWGDTSGYFGYRVNNEESMSLADPVKDGDYVYAYIYKDQVGWSDKSSWFDKNEITVKPGQPIALILYVAGYDSNWNPVTAPVDNAVITLDGETTEYKTDGNGRVTFSIDKKGTYVISALSETENLTPPVCKVIVTDKASGASQSGGDKAIRTSDDFNLIFIIIIALAALIIAVVAIRKR